MAIRPSFSAPGTDRALSTGAAPWDWRTLSDQTGQMAYNASQQSINGARTASAMVDPNAAWQQAQRQRITDLTEGRATELANDPRMAEAMNFFGSVLNGSKLPFSEETQRAQLNQQANGTAAANAAQLRALEEAIVARGGSLNDPSFQAKKQEMMSQRQGQNLDALGRMLAQAGTANFNAQAQGATSLAGIRGAQNAQVNQMNLAGANFRGQDFRDVNTGGVDNGGWSTTTTSILGGRGSVAPAFNPTGAFGPQAPTAPAALAGGPGRTTGVVATPQTHTLATGNTWGGQPYGGYVAPPVPKQPTFGSPFIRPLGPGQF